MTSDPWFHGWNYEILRVIFRLIPHQKATDDFFESLIFNPLLSTWIFAFTFYWFWTKDSEQKEQTRGYLLIAIGAFFIACLVTLILRPWIHWAAPVLRTDFQPLFPSYLWGNGVANCFPSHSTLAYFTIAAGFWPLHRRLSMGLMITALLLISFPRVYEGGHYPIDVLFSCSLGTVVLIIFWHWPFLLGLSKSKPVKSAPLGQILFFLWVFELGEGFRGLQLLASFAIRKFASE
jgi:membrane-associated phospholipid phosphatase